MPVSSELNRQVVVKCPGCQTENGHERRFCSQCGQSLWDKCVSCGKPQAVGEDFCGSCGENLKEFWNSRLAQCQSELKQAVQLRDEFQFDEALIQLAAIAKEDHARLRPFAHKAEQLIVKFSAERKSQAARAERAIEKAAQYAKSYSYESMVAVLSEIPTPLRTSEMSRLLQVAASRRQEILALSGDIRQLIRAKNNDIAPLLKKLERLLELLPQHQQAQVLAVELRDRVILAAKKRIAHGEYREAQHALNQLFPYIRSEESEQLSAKVGELVWMIDSIHTAPIVDSALMRIAAKAVKQSRGDEKLQQLHEKVTARARTKPADVRFPHPKWATPPKRTRFGFPVDWLCGSQRIGGWDSLNTKDHINSAGSFFTACGLALQAIGGSHVTINLANTTPKRGLLGRFGLRSKKDCPANAGWGIDVGSTSVKAVRLSRSADDDKHQIGVCRQIEFSDAAASVDNSEPWLPAIQQLLAERDFNGESVAVSLRGAQVTGRFFALPPLEANKVDDAIKFEVSHQIPMPIGDLQWDYRVTTNDRDQRSVALVASRKLHAGRTADLLRSLGLNLKVVQCEGVALHNFAMHEFMTGGEPEQLNAAIATLDIGGDSTNLVISGHDTLWFRNFPIGGATFTKSLVDAMHLTSAQACDFKHRPAAARRVSEVYRALHPVFAKLENEIERSLAAYARENGDKKVGHMYCVGGGMHMHGLLKCLQSGADSILA